MEFAEAVRTLSDRLTLFESMHYARWEERAPKFVRLLSIQQWFRCFIAFF